MQVKTDLFYVAAGVRVPENTEPAAPKLFVSSVALS